MIYSLTDLKRYNNKIKCKSESVSEHMYFCGYILLRLRKYLTLDEHDFNILLQYLLIHDVGEIVSGDLPYNVKAENPQLRAMVDKIEDDYMVTLGFEHIIDSVMHNPYDNNLKKLFKFVDTLQVIQYCRNEMLLGNATKEMKTILETAMTICTNILSDLDGECFKTDTPFVLDMFIEQNF